MAGVKPETKFWHRLRDNTKQVHWLRVENEVTAGAPDVNGFYNDREVWIELKIMRKHRIKIRHTQLRYVYQRCVKAGAENVWVVARDEEDGSVKMWWATTLWHRERACAMTSDRRRREDDQGVTFDPGPPDVMFCDTPGGYGDLVQHLFGRR